MVSRWDLSLGTARPSPGQRDCSRPREWQLCVEHQEGPGWSRAPQAGSGPKAAGESALGLAVPGFGGCHMCDVQKSGQVSGEGLSENEASVSIWTALWGIQSAVQPTGLTHQGLPGSP